MKKTKIIFHKNTEKPETYDLCLVFFNKFLHPRIYRYLDETDKDVQEFGNGEGFYEDNEPMSDGGIKLKDIFGWIDVNELDKLVREK